MRKITKKRARELEADRAIVLGLYRDACAAEGKERVDRDLTRLWTLRCRRGLVGAIPFAGGMECKSLGELLYVAREICGLKEER